jgi:hypothetical protein
MHFDFHFTAVQILWTLTFAGQLVLLVVLLGRDRARLYPWFTVGIVLMALRLLASRLLSGRMAPITLNTIFIVLADLAAIAGLLIVVEMGRRAFAFLRRGFWWAGALVMLVVGCAILAAWGPWPAWKTLTADSFLADLRLTQMGAQKLDLLVDLLTVELGVLVIALGRRFGTGWSSHTQRLVIGLSTASLAQLTTEVILQLIIKAATPIHSQAEYDRLVGLRDKMLNASGAVYVAVLVWWIIVLWLDEPGAANGAEQPAAATPEPEYFPEEDANPAQPQPNP